MAKISIHPPTLTDCGETVKVECAATGAGIPSIWFECSKNFPISDPLEVSDAFVLPALVAAMTSGQDLEINFPISEQLFFSIKEALQPFLLKFAPDLFPAEIKVSAPTQARWASASVSGSATGMSCGLDSFATVADLLALPPAHNFRLKLLCHFNTGNHDPLHTASHQQLLAERIDRSQLCAKAIGLPWVDVNSNVDEWFPGDFARLHTLRNASAAYFLSPVVRHYFYSNGYPLFETRMTSNDTASVDAILLPLLSTEKISFHQGTPALDTIGKAELISNFKPARTYLSVCIFGSDNCSMCEKCLRRMLLLDMVRVLPLFSCVFDLNRFNEKKNWYIGYVISHNKTPYYKDLMACIQAGGYLAHSSFFYRLAWWKHRAVIAAKNTFGAKVRIFK